MYLHVGLQNFVRLEDIEAMSSNVYSAPIKRMVKAAEAENRLIDCTEGRKTRSVLFMKSGSVVLACIETSTLVNRGNTLLSGGKIQNMDDDVPGDEEPSATPANTAAVTPPAPPAAPQWTLQNLPKTSDTNPATGKKFTKKEIAELKKSLETAAANASAPANNGGGLVTDLPE